jgi:hypothetical protein
MNLLASYKLFMHWVKLYYPNKVINWDITNTPEQAHEEHVAHIQLMEYLKRGPSYGERVFNFIQAVDIRETRQLRLGEPIPPSIKEEASLLFKEAQDLFDKVENLAKASSGLTKESPPM